MPTTSPTATDFVWFRERFPELSDGYCFTFAEGLSPGEALRRIGAREEGRTLSGIGEVHDVSCEMWDEFETSRLLVAATKVDGWALLAESGGFVGNLQEKQRSLSDGTRVVTVFYNIGVAHHFCWVEDGRPRLEFEFPWEAEGRDAQELAETMREAGFVLDRDGKHGHELMTEAGFALAERLTGVRLTPELLESAHFTSGVVQDAVG
jgi:hypothetical protein